MIFGKWCAFFKKTITLINDNFWNNIPFILKNICYLNATKIINIWAFSISIRLFFSLVGSMLNFYIYKNNGKSAHFKQTDQLLFCLLRTYVLLYLTKRLRDSVTPGLMDFSFFLSSTFVYEPIWLKISMNANIVKMHIFHKFKYDLKGQ